MTKTYRIQGEWAGKSAGGCLNHFTWRYNPQVLLHTGDKEATVKVKLVQNGDAKLHHIGFYVYPVDDASRRRVVAINPDVLFEKAGFVDEREVFSKITFPASDEPWAIIPCTFGAGEESSFTLICSSGDEFTCAPIEPDNEWHLASATGEWKGDTAAGCLNTPAAKLNPQFALQVKKTTTVNLVLAQNDKAAKDFDTLGFYVFKTRTDAGSRLKQLRAADILKKAEFESEREAMLTLRLDPAFYYRVVPCTFDPGFEAKFHLVAFSDLPVRLEEI